MPIYSFLTIHDLPQKHNCGFCGKYIKFLIYLRFFSLGEAVADARLFPLLSLFHFSLRSVPGVFTVRCLFVAAAPFSSVLAVLVSAVSSVLAGNGIVVVPAVSDTTTESSAVPVFTAEPPSAVSSAETTTFAIVSAETSLLSEPSAALYIIIYRDLLALVTDL